MRNFQPWADANTMARRLPCEDATDGELSLTERGDSSFTVQGPAARRTQWAVPRSHTMALHGVLRTALCILGGRVVGRTQPQVKLH
jgi:hypothetical protein